jgi:5-dehydro-4-deoxyglucarate dehydratase
MRLDGLLSFPLTPFTADRADVAWPSLSDHLERQLAAAPAALFVACCTGELTALSPAEYERVVATAVAVTAGRVPVLAGVGGGPQVARENLAAARRAGANGALLLPPYLVESTPAGLVEHVRWVAAGGGLPVIVYQRANAVLDPAAAVALLDIDEVAGIKDGRGDVDAMLRIVTAIRHSGHRRAAEFRFLNGLPTAELSAAAYAAIGVAAYSSAVLTFVPDLATAFHAALTSGDETTTGALLAAFYLPFAELRAQVPGYAVALVKAGARLSGQDVGGVRPPLLDPPPEHEQRLAAIVAAGRDALAEVRRG